MIYHLFFLTLIRGPLFFLEAFGSYASSSSSDPNPFDISQNSFAPNRNSPCDVALYQNIWSSNLFDLALLEITKP